MAWTTARTWSTGELITAAIMNVHVRDNLNALKSPPGASAQITSAQTTTSTSYVDVTSATSGSITTTGGVILTIFTASIRFSSADTANFQFVLDGAAVHIGIEQDLGTSNNTVCMVYRTGASAGAHTMKVQMKTTGGQTLTLDNTVASGFFYAGEVT